MKTKINFQTLIIAIITLLLGLITINKFWFPYDDGITLTSAEMTLNGMVPYRDFVVPYTPLQYYIIALLFKIFGLNHLIARLYTVLIYVFIATFSFVASRKLSENSKIAYFSWFACAMLLVPRLGANVSATWSGLGFSYLCILFMWIFINKKRILFLFLAGLFSGFAILSKQDLGVYIAAAILCALIVTAFSGSRSNVDRLKPLFRYIAVFSGGLIIMPVISLAYMLYFGIFRHSAESLISVLFAVNLYSKIPISPPCFDLRQIFHGSLYFISINQFYIPLLTYLTAAILLFKSFVSEKNTENDTTRNILALLFLLFGIFSYSFVLYRSDDMHLLIIMPSAAVMVSYIYYKSRSITAAPAKIFIRTLLWLILFLFVLFSIKNCDKFIKNSITKICSKKIIKLENSRGSIYVPVREYAPVRDLLDFIGKNTNKGDKILVWNRGSSAVSDGTDIILYFFSGRLPSTKYFVVQPGYTNREDIQKEIVASLLNNKVKLVVLLGNKDTGLYDKKTDGPIDEYVEAQYYLAKKLGYFYVFLKK